MKPGSFLARWDISRLAAPRNCLICDLPESPPICPDCLNLLEPIHHKGCRRCGNPGVANEARQCAWCQRLGQLPQDLCTLFAYRNEGREIYHRVKYQGHWSLLPTLIHQGMPGFFQKLPFKSYQCLCPIPESLSRKWSRTFNPAALLAEGLSRTTGLPDQALLKIRLFKPHQVGLDYQQRRKNAMNRFMAQPGPYPDPCFWLMMY